MKTILTFGFLALFQLCFSEIEIPSSSFKVWRQVQKTTQKNHIKLRFKTIHSTGLIMFARGADKNDFLSVELYRGKIRVAGNFANGTLNALRPISGHYDMYAGKDLADNEWHTVEIIRNIRQCTIYIDRGVHKKERMVFSKSPPTYTEFSVSMVTFAGFFSFATSEISSKVSLSRKGFSGCLTEATFSQDWVQVPAGQRQPYRNIVDFLAPQSTSVGRKQQGMETIGNTKQICEETIPPYKPLFFKSSPVHMTLVENYTIQKLKMDLKFRTVVNYQVLANYSTIGTNEQIMLGIDRKGKVSLTFYFKRTTKIITTAKENFHDAEWHSASFNIENEANANGEYQIQFTVDGKTRLSAMTEKFYFNGFINIGFGFTGCMRDIKINDEDLEKVRRHPDVANDYFKVSDVGVVHNVCSLKDYCNPNPCQNGGKCNQTDDNIICDCKGTLYEGSTCHRPRFNYTCAGVRKSGERRSDVYYIDMDGMGPMPPVRALCDLGKTIETTVTQINNTKIVDMDVTSKTRERNVDINYQASIIQMRELIMNSDICQQFIKYTCKGTPIFNSPSGPPKTSWMGGDDVVHFYWGGAKGKRGYCACGVSNDCKVSGVPNGKYCNCDSLSKFGQVRDEGNFSIKAHLPVRQVQFKSVLKGSVEALLRVGHLRCSGFGSHDIAATFRKRYSFLSVYHPDQPFDNIQAGGISFDFKSSLAYNHMTMIHAHGPFSGNYIKIMVFSKTMVRVLLDLGFGPLKQDVDIETTGRTLDDNQWHEMSVMFNMKELNVTLDGIEMIQGLPLQEYPVFFSVDATPVYVGGSFYDRYGYIGCIRSLYVNGRIFNIKSIAEGQEDFGVYPGCGSACKLLNRPCNYGNCFDEYDSFRCNCSVSPYDGKFCQNETNPKSFSSGSIVYDLQRVNKSKPLAAGLLVIGFKTTTSSSVALGQIEGLNGRHYSLALINGYLTLYWNLKNKDLTTAGSVVQLKTEILQIDRRKLNNGQHHVVKLTMTMRELWIEVSNYNLSVGTNVTESELFNEDKTAKVGNEPDSFGIPVKIRIGSMENIKMENSLVQVSFSGCMSGAKFVYTPHATKTDRFPDPIEFDFFKLIEEDVEGNNGQNSNDALTLSGVSTVEFCGPNLETPGELPTVGPLRQFVTKSPGFDRSVIISETNWVNQLLICVIIVVVVVVILTLLYCTYKKVNANMTAYSKLRRNEIQTVHMKSGNKGSEMKPIVQIQKQQPKIEIPQPPPQHHGHESESEEEAKSDGQEDMLGWPDDQGML